MNESGTTSTNIALTVATISESPQYYPIFDTQEIDNQGFNTRAKLDPLKFCNKDCGFCYYTTQLKERDELSEARAKGLIHYLKQKGIDSIDISGGEPLLWTHLVPTIKNIKEENLWASIITNGTDPKKFEEALKQGLDEVIFSMHGVNSHDQVVKRSNSFDTLKKCWFLALKYDIVIRWNVVLEGDYVLDKDTVSFLHLRLLGGDQVNLLPLNNWSDAHKSLSYEELKRVYHTIDTMTNEIKAVNLKIGQFNIRYPIWCMLSDSSRRFARGIFHHVIDKADWNRYYYPQDLKYVDINNGENPYLNHLDPRVSSFEPLPSIEQLKSGFDLINIIRTERKDTKQFCKNLACAIQNNHYFTNNMVIINKH